MIIGIDPGKTGAIAFVNKNGIEVIDTPLNKGDYDIDEMSDILDESTFSEEVERVFIEKVHSMPGQGVASMFNFGMGYGIWLGICSAFKYPVTLVTPQEWKKEMNLISKPKDDARAKVMKLFPKHSLLVPRKKDIGRADAILIAEYGKRKLLK
ncbi:MAG: crossover junction endodeoxyribonuclease [Bacteroidetes bacterium]|nr:MAG: crossover junction endodeoxyribonuclease [Bacteroidota bacterium]